MEFYSYIYKFLFTAITLVVISLVSCIFIFADRMGFERDDCILEFCSCYGSRYIHYYNNEYSDQVMTNCIIINIYYICNNIIWR